MRRILGQKFFARPAPIVAPELLGKFLVRKLKDKEIALQIMEVEAYDGFHDRASHAARGKTLRNEIMFGPPGYWYVYLVYGMHWMLNIVTAKEKYPAAVLIRGVNGIYGPGKVTKYFKITEKLNGHFSQKNQGLWIEDRGIRIQPRRIQKTARIGVAYVGSYWSSRRWRFIVS